MDLSNFARPQITNDSHLAYWIRSTAYHDYRDFLVRMNDYAPDYYNEEIVFVDLRKMAKLLDELSGLIDEIPPITDDNSQRYGNRAFQTWYDQMQYNTIEECIAVYHQTIGPELCVYLHDSFGNRTRIDYGTGHEMNFVIFLMGVYKCVQVPEAVRVSNDRRTLSRPMDKHICTQLMTLFVHHYLPLVRKLQTTYRLEPAGSHGVYSLDDFQFLPFYWGAAQLTRSPLSPNTFHNKQIAEANEKEYFFYSAIVYIHKVKRGPFAEHSNQLWNISGINNWKKINTGLLKMYENDFLPKFPIVQHLKFGPNVLIWKTHSALDNRVSVSPNRYLSCEVLKVIDDIIYKFRYDIIYSPVYQVPVIYFRVENSSGSSVDLEWIWNRIPKLYLEHQTSSSSPSDPFETYGRIVTQIMHPVDGSPCFYIHPCNTSKLMSNVNLSADKKKFYLTSWLSSISPIIGYDFRVQNYTLNK